MIKLKVVQITLFDDSNCSGREFNVRKVDKKKPAASFMTTTDTHLPKWDIIMGYKNSKKKSL